MTHFGEMLRETIEEARQIHCAEREQVNASIMIISKLAKMRAEHYLTGKHTALAQKIGLTPDQYFKRLRVAKLSWYFPQVLEHLREGTTCLSHASLLVDKMTQANEQVIWANILGKGRRDVEDFLRRVQCDGTVKAKSDEMITLTLTVTTDQEAMIHRLTEVLSARGRVPSTTEAIMAAVDKLLDQRDLMRRASKMAVNDQKKESALSERTAAAPTAQPTPTTPCTVARQCEEDPQAEVGIASRPESPAATVRDAQFCQDLLSLGSGANTRAARVRRPLPASVRRAVYRKTGGVCQHILPDGSRCGATSMLEIDHVVPLSRGGSDDASNLTLICREHNHYRARLLLGAEIMDRYRP